MICIFFQNKNRIVFTFFPQKLRLSRFGLFQLMGPRIKSKEVVRERTCWISKMGIQIKICTFIRYIILSHSLSALYSVIIKLSLSLHAQSTELLSSYHQDVRIIINFVGLRINPTSDRK
jgi:hypothetical protein